MRWRTSLFMLLQLETVEWGLRWRLEGQPARPMFAPINLDGTRMEEDE